MSAFQGLFPDLINEGRLYWLKAPIYKVTNKKGNFYYYTEEEFENHENGEIIRFKGLGQMDEEDLRESLFNEKWQHLEQIQPTEEGSNALYELMGSDVEPRKKYIQSMDFGNFDL